MPNDLEWDYNPFNSMHDLDSFPHVKSHRSNI